MREYFLFNYFTAHYNRLKLSLFRSQEAYRKEQFDFSGALSHEPDLLFKKCREMMENYDAYRSVPLSKPSAPTPTPLASSAGDIEMTDGNVSVSFPHIPRPEPPLELQTLIQRVSETIAKDLSRLQMQKSLYTEYRSFTLIHAVKDQPMNLKTGEVSCSLCDVSRTRMVVSMMMDG